MRLVHFWVECGTAGLALRADIPVLQLLQRLRFCCPGGDVDAHCTCLERFQFDPTSECFILCRWSHDQIFAATAQERSPHLADLVDDLDETQLATPSLCAGWDVKTVGAHLVELSGRGQS